MIYMHNRYEEFKNNNLLQKYPKDIGYDIRCPHLVKITPGTYAKVDTGLHLKMPDFLGGFVKSRSGIGINLSTECSNAGVIDPSYTGSIVVKLYNFNLNDPMIIKTGERFCQLVFTINPKMFFKSLRSCKNMQQLLMFFHSLDFKIKEKPNQGETFK